MIKCITERNGTIHILYYLISSKRKFSIKEKYLLFCNKQFDQRYSNTLIIDKKSDNICKKCIDNYNSLWQFHQEKDRFRGKNVLNKFVVQQISFTKLGSYSPEYVYNHFQFKDYWRKIRFYKNLLRK